MAVYWTSIVVVKVMKAPLAFIHFVSYRWLMKARWKYFLLTTWFRGKMRKSVFDFAMTKGTCTHLELISFSHSKTFFIFFPLYFSFSNGYCGKKERNRVLKRFQGAAIFNIKWHFFCFLYNPALRDINRWVIAWVTLTAMLWCLFFYVLT